MEKEVRGYKVQFADRIYKELNIQQEPKTESLIAIGKDPQKALKDLFYTFGYKANIRRVHNTNPDFHSADVITESLCKDTSRDIDYSYCAYYEVRSLIKIHSQTEK